MNDSGNRSTMRPLLLSSPYESRVRAASFVVSAVPSIIFVVGMMFAKNAIVKGTSPWTGTFFGNLWLAIIWAVYGISTGDLLPVAGWWQAAVIGLTFFLGQLFTYLAFQYGDVSVATPIFGVKVSDHRRTARGSSGE